jgi:hypothetical protein
LKNLVVVPDTQKKNGMGRRCWTQQVEAFLSMDPPVTRFVFVTGLSNKERNNL